MNADGTGQIRLTNNSSVDLYPAFSPDGQKISMTGGDSGPDWARLTCQGEVVTIGGSVGDDVLSGTAGSGVIHGGNGDDTIKGGGGADVICSGPGNDTVDYSDHEAPVTADVFGNAADDGSVEDGPAGARDAIDADVENLTGGFGDDTLTGNSQQNILGGGPGEDTLVGMSSDDTLYGGSGDDTLGGREGADTLDGGSGGEVVRGGEDTDTATYDSRSAGVTVTAGAGDDGGSIDGPTGERDTVGALVENLTGGAGRDTLTGSDLDNLLVGGAGGDVFSGGAGTDIVTYADRTFGSAGDGDDRWHRQRRKHPRLQRRQRDNPG